MEVTTEVCRLCRFPAELDDVALHTATGRYICLHCFPRDKEPRRPFPRTLRRELEALLLNMDEPGA